MGRFSLPKKATQYKLSQETADAAVLELLAYYAIDEEELPAEQRGFAPALFAKLSRYYRMGYLENVREGNVLRVKQHLQEPPGEVHDLVYGRMSAAAKLATDGFKETERYARMHALMGSLCETPILSALSGVDMSVMETLAAVFMLG
jgi:hypothetical protein